MKKLIIYTGLLLVTLITSFGFLNNVYAVCEDYNTCRTGSIHGEIRVGGDGSGLYASGVSRINKSSEDYYYTSIGVTAYFNRTGSFIYSGYIDANATYRLYCLDAQYVGTNPLYASRFLLDTNHNISIQALDVALLSILTGNGGTGGLVSSTRGADYWARLLAMRAVVAVFGVHNASSGTYNSAYYAGLTATNNFLSHSSTRAAYDELSSALSALGYSITPVTSFSSHTNYYFSGSPVSTAEAYFVAALKDAAEYVRNYSEGANVDPDTTLPMPTEIETTEDSVGTMVERDVTHTIYVSGLPKNDTNSFTIDGITLDHEYAGLDYYIKSIKIGDDLLETSNAGQDLAQFLGVNLLGGGSTWDFTEETKIEITVHFEGFVDSEFYDELECGDSEIKYSINGTASTSIQSKYSEYVATIWYSGTSKKQRYLGIEPASGEQASSSITQWSSPFTTNLIDACDCTDLIEACEATGSMDSPECQELLEENCGECVELEVECNLGDQDACDQFAAVCEVECGTTVDNFNCCDAENHLVFAPVDEWEVNIKGPEDVYTCFVSQIDGQVDLSKAESGSSTDSIDYTKGGASGVAGAVDDVDNPYTLDQNRYCVISCKEDYMMTMPTAKLVNAGRYFTFKAAVEGTKTCYTNTIDRELYNEDIKRAQEELVKAYNTWSQLKALEDTPFTERETVEFDIDVNCHWDTSCATDEDPDCRECDNSSQTCSYEVAKKVISYETYDINGTLTNVTGEEHQFGKNEGEESCSCDGTAGTCGTSTSPEDDYEEQYGGKLEDAAADLATAQNNYNIIIEQYNACSGWETELQYDEENPHVYYDYEESYIEDLGYEFGEMTSVINNKNTSEWYCNGNATGKYDYTYGTVDSAYEADTCYKGEGYSVTEIQYVYCEEKRENGCQLKTEEISDATYKKITSTVDAEYIPATMFYNIYPSGEVTNTEVDNSVPIENGLPVSLATPRGIYKYTVNISGLGEFYDQGSVFENPTNGDPGRLIASEAGDNSVINKDEYGEFVDENGTVQYACSYLVNMGKEGIDYIVCDFDTECVDGDCIADCVGPNCDYECYGDDCIADCIGAGCIYDSDAGTSLIERTISLSNLFPNGTDSYNWNRDVNEKAATTIDEIQEVGNAVYEEEPILSVTITPSVARAIKQYNDDAEGDGGYSNDTLACYKINDSKGLIACYSSFIESLIQGEYGDVVNDQSTILDVRNEGENNTEYFTTWSSGISEEDMIGPSWK